MQFKDDKELPADSNNYLKLKDKESVTGVFRGFLFDYLQHYSQAEKKSYVCTGPGCLKCKEGDKPGFRFKINFVVREPNAFVPKIFESGKKLYTQLRDLHHTYKGLDKVIVSITRAGQGPQTLYTILPRPEWQVSEKLEQALSKIQLNELLPKKGDENAAAPTDFDGPDSNEDIPF